MSDYDFRSLSPVDFEHLARDILNADLDLVLQSYAAGRDQGIDLRQVRLDGTIVVGQCKHYLESSWSTFLRAVRKEAAKGKDLRADRYLFVTSRSLTPRQQDTIVEELAGLPVTHDDVWGREALNAALGRHPPVERGHIKLWLWSTAMLDHVVRASRWQRSDATLEDAREQARLWVHTREYDQVQAILEREGVCIVSGPPGVGKTFLAEMSLLSAVTRDGWEAIHLSGDIEDGWDALRSDESRQFFYFNDFLGETQLTVASKNEPTNLERFIKRVKHLRKNKRFIMTTREQILGEAATSAYDPLQRVVANTSQVGVRIGEYSARAKAEMLFNHLYFSGIADGERAHLAVDNRIISIVEHPAYNPRLIQLAIEKSQRLSAEEIAETIEWSLDQPHEVWDTSFRSLPGTGQQILLSLAGLPARAWPLDTIRLLTGSTGSLDWKPTLRVLEPTWLRITAGRDAALANPSCRDYLLGVLDDTVVAGEQVDRIRTLAQIMSLSRSAGLVSDMPASLPRPELAHALMSRRSRLAEHIRGFVGADGDSADLKALRDAAALLGVYGAESDTGWLMDEITQTLTFTPALQARPADLFLLAERLSALPATAQDSQTALAERLVLTGIGEAATTRDLDAYEALPEQLRTSASGAAARQVASGAIAAEVDYLLTGDEPEAIRGAAADLERRASWYGLETDIGPLLDRADDLAAAEDATSVQSEPERQPDDSGPVDIAELFSHLTE